MLLNQFSHFKLQISPICFVHLYDVRLLVHQMTQQSDNNVLPDFTYTSALYRQCRNPVDNAMIESLMWTSSHSLGACISKGEDVSLPCGRVVMYFVLFYFLFSLVVIFFLLKFSLTWVVIWYLDFVKPL